VGKARECTAFPPRNSAGRGLMDSEMSGNLGQCVCTGPAGVGDRLVSGDRRFGDLRQGLAGRSFFGTFP